MRIPACLSIPRIKQNAPPDRKSPCSKRFQGLLSYTSYEIRCSKFPKYIGVDTMCAVGANRCIVGAPIGAWVRRRCVRMCILEPWVQNGCIIRFRDAPMQYAYAPMSKNRCIIRKESPAANLLAVSKKAAGLLSICFSLPLPQANPV